MSTIQTSSALRVARVDLNTTNNTTLYTVPSRYDSIVESIIVSEDSGNADTITITLLMLALLSLIFLRLNQLVLMVQ